MELQAQNPYENEEDIDFKPNPNLLEMLNANMRK